LPEGMGGTNGPAFFIPACDQTSANGAGLIAKRFYPAPAARDKTSLYQTLVYNQKNRKNQVTLYLNFRSPFHRFF